MARAKRPACQSLALAGRHFLPGHVWHIKHQCHKKEFLLKFARDRCRWLQWLFEAKKRYGRGGAGFSQGIDFTLPMEISCKGISISAISFTFWAES